MIERDELVTETGYSARTPSHCGPDAIYMSALGGANGGDEGGGIFLLDCESFDPLGAWEVDRGPQRFAYDFWWHLGYDTLLTSEWGTPAMFENGVVPEKLLGREYGHRVHVWDLRKRRHLQALDLGDEHQMVLELRPAHDPRKAYGFVGVVVSVEDLSASVWLWHRDGDGVDDQEGDHDPGRAGRGRPLPELLKGFGAVPPLVTDINLSLDDQQPVRLLLGHRRLPPVRRVRSVQPAARRARCGWAGSSPASAHPSSGPLTGGPQMVELSRDGRRVYVIELAVHDLGPRSSIRTGWTAGSPSSTSVRPAGCSSTPTSWSPNSTAGVPHQVRLDGGDASSDSYCFP